MSLWDALRAKLRSGSDHLSKVAGRLDAVALEVRDAGYDAAAGTVVKAAQRVENVANDLEETADEKEDDWW